MAELLLKIRVSVKIMFTPILRLALTPINYDMGFFIKAFLNRLIQFSYTCLVFISLVLRLVILEAVILDTTVPLAVSTQ